MAKAATKSKSTKTRAAKATPAKSGRTKAASAKSSSTKTTPTKTKWKSRAVTRLIEAGSMTECVHCEERVKFKARERHQQVICNVYINGSWDRVEHYHEPCYADAGKPFGEPVD